MGIINKAKHFLGIDIKNEKYALVDDPIFGKVAKEKAPDKWVRSTCGYCGVGCGMYSRPHYFRYTKMVIFDGCAELSEWGHSDLRGIIILSKK
jgi:antibiotic biosynthesis monooxygenase (ABM) superfamily enzyme